MTQFPAGAVVVRVPRSEFPAVFNVNGYHQEHPYIGVDTYNLVIVPSGVVRSRMDVVDLQEYGFLYSGKSGRLYVWIDYYSYEMSRRSTDVGGEKVFVECVPPKDHHNPPRSVNVYASTAGVAWLAFRAAFGGTGDPGINGTQLTSLDDAPFSTYLDMLDEMEIAEPVRKLMRHKLELFFGLKS